MKTEQIAKVAHEANRAYCESLGDPSQQPWRNAPQWQRDSAVNGVKFHQKNPNAGDAASHENWMREKQSAGWVYGATKNEDRKTHPCLVTFAELPTDQQRKDSLFRATVHALS